MYFKLFISNLIYYDKQYMGSGKKVTLVLRSHLNDEPVQDKVSRRKDKVSEF